MSDQSNDQHDQRPSRQRPAWIAGGVLILVGIVFIVRNVSGLYFDNWWALFILIPHSDPWSPRGRCSSATTGDSPPRRADPSSAASCCSP